MAEYLPSIHLKLHPENGKGKPLTVEDLQPGNRIQYNQVDYRILCVIRPPNGKDRHPVPLALLQTPGIEDSDSEIEKGYLHHVTDILMPLSNGLWRRFVFPEAPTVQQVTSYIHEKGVPQIPGIIHLKDNSNPQR